MTGKLKEGYGIVQRDIMIMDISVYSKAVYCLLVSFSGEKTYCYPSLKTITDSLKISKTTTLKAIKELEKNVLIKVFKRKNQDIGFESNCYQPFHLLADPCPPDVLPLVHDVDTKNIYNISCKQQKEKKEDLTARVENFRGLLVPFVPEFGRDLVRDFFDYWTELSTGGQTFRMEGERYFDIKRRLSTFKKNSSKFTKPENARATTNYITN